MVCERDGPCNEIAESLEKYKRQFLHTTGTPKSYTKRADGGGDGGDGPLFIALGIGAAVGFTLAIIAARNPPATK